MLVNEIINTLKTGSIPDVFLFTDIAEFPAPPYVVVKPETGIFEGSRQYRITAHHKTGMYDVIEKYVLEELADLLITNSNGERVTLTDEDGRSYKVYSSGYSDVMPDGSDSTIFMERLFYQPMLRGGY
jgi:hypothetical protein